MISKPEKARAIVEWFDDDKPKTYARFRDEIEGGGNIVEYEDSLRLRHKGQLTPRNILLTL
jgi:hypothetical protein